MNLFNRLNCYFLVVFFLTLLGQASGADITAFGPKQYVRTTGAPNIYTDDFTAEPGEARRSQAQWWGFHQCE